MKRTAFFISDGTGITSETLGHSLLAQFEDVEFTQITLPFIDSIEKANEVVGQINISANEDNSKPIIFDTIVNHDIRNVIAQSKGFLVDIFGTFIKPLEQELQQPSSYTVGKSHSISEDTGYKHRIDAVNYALDNDDGARTRNYIDADIILIGVSRCGKTPTCLYLALQFGIRAANYPLTEEDIEDFSLPKVLKEHKRKLFGLTIDSERLAAIRTERKPDSRYATHRQCEQEVEAVESIFRQSGIPYIDTTHFSVEEISTRILVEAGLERRLQ